MAGTITIPVGADKAAQYLAFGDDSQFGDYLAFAFVIVRRDHLRYAEERLSGLKRYYKIPNDVPLHCRVLFNEHQRNKAGLSHLSSDDARVIISKSVSLINRVPLILRYADDTLSRVTGSLGKEVEFTHHTDGSKFKAPVTPDPKAWLGVLMQSCFMVPANGSGGPTAAQCEIYVAEDSTKVGFIGPNRQRADRMYVGYSDIGAPSGGVFQLQPTIIQADVAPMLQLADVAAYMCSHAFEVSSDKNFFRDQLRRVEYWWKAGQGTHPKEGKVAGAGPFYPQRIFE
jgi:hypothetical protein